MSGAAREVVSGIEECTHRDVCERESCCDARASGRHRWTADTHWEEVVAKRKAERPRRADLGLHQRGLIREREACGFSGSAVRGLRAPGDKLVALRHGLLQLDHPPHEPAVVRGAKAAAGDLHVGALGGARAGHVPGGEVEKKHSGGSLKHRTRTTVAEWEDGLAAADPRTTRG